MAIELGELREYLDGGEIRFSVGGKQYAHAPSAQTVLQFQAEYREALAEPSRMTNFQLWKWGAQLLGGDFDKDTQGLSGGLLDELVADGVDHPSLDRVFNAVIIAHWHSNDAALTYFKTGDVGKALGVTEKQIEAAVKKAAEKAAAKEEEAPAEEKPKG